MGSGVEKRSVKASVYDVLLGAQPLSGAKVKASVNYDLVPANRELAGAEVELVNGGPGLAGMEPDVTLTELINELNAADQKSISLPLTACVRLGR